VPEGFLVPPGLSLFPGFPSFPVILSLLDLLAQPPTVRRTSSPNLSFSTPIGSTPKRYSGFLFLISSFCAFSGFKTGNLATSLFFLMLKKVPPALECCFFDQTFFSFLETSTLVFEPVTSLYSPPLSLRSTSRTRPFRPFCLSLFKLDFSSRSLKGNVTTRLPFFPSPPL